MQKVRAGAPKQSRKRKTSACKEKAGRRTRSWSERLFYFHWYSFDFFTSEKQQRRNIKSREFQKELKAEVGDETNFLVSVFALRMLDL